MAIREKSAQAKHRYSASAKSLFVAVIVLLIGASILLMTLDALKQRQGFDGAYYALNAVSLIDQPRFTPFFSDNLGRESGWEVATRRQ